MSEQEREAFEAKFKHLSFARKVGAWGEYVYANQPVQDLWEGWIARASLPDSAGEAGPVGDVDQHGYFTQRPGAAYFPGGPVYARPAPVLAAAPALTDEDGIPLHPLRHEGEAWSEQERATWERALAPFRPDWANYKQGVEDGAALAAAPSPAVKGYHPGVSGEAECDVPPFGWRCTRAKGHEGPCAAIEDAEGPASVERGMKRLRDAGFFTPDVLCPVCASVAGQPCTDFMGKVRPEPHAERRKVTALAAPSHPPATAEPPFSCFLERDFGRAPCDRDCGKLRCMYPSEPAVAVQAEHSIACPHCLVKAGEPCIWPETTVGHYRTLSHVARMEAAAHPKPAAPATAELHEQLAKLGWQAIECELCGSSARAFPQPPATADDAVSDAQIAKHTMSAKECPPDSKVILVSSLHRLRSGASAQPAEGGATDTEQAEKYSDLAAICANCGQSLGEHFGLEDRCGNEGPTTTFVRSAK